MEQTYFAEAFEVGYYLFTTSDQQDLTVVSAGVYYVDNTEVTVDSNGKIIKIQNNLTSETSEYKDTNHNFFGGDTFINRFSIKRKHSFFKNNSYQLPNNTNINYSLYPNVGYPIYFFNTQENSQKDIYYSFFDSIGSPLNLSLITKEIKNLGSSYDNLLNIIKGQFLNPYNYLKAPNYNLDCRSSIDSNLFSFNPVKGVIYTYYYGIPYFLVESDVNLDLRESTNKESEFYPLQSNLGLWLQDDYNRFANFDQYKYDKSFSKQSTEFKSRVSDPLFKGDRDHLINKNQRIIYSAESSELEENNYNDRYLINKPLDYYDFSYDTGSLTGIEALENNTLLVRFSKGIKVFNAQLQIETSAGQANLTSGRLFQNKPQEFLKNDFGYIGTNYNSFLSTPFGHVLVDSALGQVFLLGTGARNIKELSQSQVSSWLRQNLPFELNKYFPTIEEKGLNKFGIVLGYDNKYSTLYITKIDYKPITSLEYRNNKFYISNSNIEVNLYDPKYFKNLSWTLSYSFKKQEWVGFHSFTPNLYLNYGNHFDTFIKGVNKGSFWKHNISNKSYLTYYGRVHPFIIDIQQTSKFENEIVKNITYYTDVLKYYNDYDFRHLDNEGFNEAVVYNKDQNSGLLKLDYNKSNDLNYLSSLPVEKLTNSSKISLRGKEGKFNFNQFKNISKNFGLDWILSDNNVLKKLNDSNLNYFDNSINNDYIRGSINHVRLISYNTDNKVIFKGLVINGKLSGR